MTGMGNLLPPKLPPLNSVTGSFDQNSNSLTTSIYSPHNKTIDNNMRPRMLSQRSLTTNSMLTSSLTDAQRMSLSAENYENSDNNNYFTDNIHENSLLTSQEDSLHTINNTVNNTNSNTALTTNNRESPSNKMKSNSNKQNKSPTHIPFASHIASIKASSHNNSIGNSNSNSKPSSARSHRGQDFTQYDDASMSSVEDNIERRSSFAPYITDELTLLVSKPMALPFESKNCLVQVYISKTYDENIYLKVITSGMSPQMLCERPLQIDKAYEVVNTVGHSSHLIHGSDNEDLATLSALLINMFQEADDDGSGKLKYCCCSCYYGSRCHNVLFIIYKVYIISFFYLYFSCIFMSFIFTSFYSHTHTHTLFLLTIFDYITLFFIIFI